MSEAMWAICANLLVLILAAAALRLVLRRMFRPMNGKIEANLRVMEKVRRGLSTLGYCGETSALRGVDRAMPRSGAGVHSNGSERA